MIFAWKLVQKKRLIFFTFFLHLYFNYDKEYLVQFFFSFFFMQLIK